MVSKFISKKTKFLCIGICVLGLISSIATAHLSGSLAVPAITERLKPMGQVNVVGVDANAAAAAAAGATVGGPQAIYNNNCKMCHETGVAGAPKFGNHDDWAPRAQQGIDTLVQAAIHGIRAMPPKGNCLKCTEADIRDTVQFMLDHAK